MVPAAGPDLAAKLDLLRSEIAAMDSALVAFSGGVDSTLLLRVAHDVLGDGVVALTAVSPSLPGEELSEARALARSIGARHVVVESNEVYNPTYRANPTNRCFYCKDELYSICGRKAKELGVRFVLDGANLDDLGDHRPGREAAQQAGVRSPLIEAGLQKGEIRELSRKLGLPTWNKPQLACLSSRFPYGTEISVEKLKRVEECERILRREGFHQFRVRYHGDVARIEVEPQEIARFADDGLRDRISEAMKKHGFQYVALDLEGYRSGSLNACLVRINTERTGGQS